MAPILAHIKKKNTYSYSAISAQSTPRSSSV